MFMMMMMMMMLVVMMMWIDAYSEDVHNSPSDSQPDMQSLPHEGELDFYETNCHWRGCGVEFDTQDELVRVFAHVVHHIE